MACFCDTVCSTSSGRNSVRKQGRRGWSHEGQREVQELDIRMWFHHIKSEYRTQTFTLHTRPNPLCVEEWVKLPPHWSCDDTTKSDFDRLFGWFSCVRTEVHVSSFDMKTSQGSFETPSWFRDVHDLCQVATPEKTCLEKQNRIQTCTQEPFVGSSCSRDLVVDVEDWSHTDRSLLHRRWPRITTQRYYDERVGPRD